MCACVSARARARVSESAGARVYLFVRASVRACMFMRVCVRERVRVLVRMRACVCASARACRFVLLPRLCCALRRSLHCHSARLRACLTVAVSAARGGRAPLCCRSLVRCNGSGRVATPSAAARRYNARCASAQVLAQQLAVIEWRNKVVQRLDEVGDRHALHARARASPTHPRAHAHTHTRTHARARARTPTGCAWWSTPSLPALPCARRARSLARMTVAAWLRTRCTRVGWSWRPGTRRYG
jgi:hypothetical protein